MLWQIKSCGMNWITFTVLHLILIVLHHTSSVGVLCHDIYSEEDLVAEESAKELIDKSFRRISTSGIPTHGNGPVPIFLLPLHFSRSPAIQRRGHLMSTVPKILIGLSGLQEFSSIGLGGMPLLRPTTALTHFMAAKMIKSALTNMPPIKFSVGLPGLKGGEAGFKIGNDRPPPEDEEEKKKEKKEKAKSKVESVTSAIGTGLKAAGIKGVKITTGPEPSEEEDEEEEEESQVEPIVSDYAKYASSAPGGYYRSKRPYKDYAGYSSMAYPQRYYAPPPRSPGYPRYPIPGNHPPPPIPHPGYGPPLRTPNESDNWYGPHNPLATDAQLQSGARNPDYDFGRHPPYPHSAPFPPAWSAMRQNSSQSMKESLDSSTYDEDSEDDEPEDRKMIATHNVTKEDPTKEDSPLQVQLFYHPDKPPLEFSPSLSKLGELAAMTGIGQERSGYGTGMMTQSAREEHRSDHAGQKNSKPAPPRMEPPSPRAGPLPLPNRRHLNIGSDAQKAGTQQG